MAINAGNISIIQQDIIAQSTNYSQNILFVGCKESAGSANHLELKKVSSINDINTFFGSNSHISQGLKMAIELDSGRAIDHYLNIDAIAINPATDATNSIASIIISGTTLSTQDITLYTCNDKQPIIFTIVKNETASEIANKLILAINAKTTLPFIASIDSINTAKIILTSTQKSSFLNGISVELLNLPTTITATIVNFENGTNGTVADISKLRQAIQNKQYHCIVIERDFFSIDTELAEFFNQRMVLIQNMHKQGHVVCCFISTHSNASTFIAPFNKYQYGVFTAVKRTTHMPFLIATYQALVMTGMLIFNYNISDLITTKTGRGSPEHANKAINEIYLNGMRPLNENYTDEELRNLKSIGYLTLENTNNNQYTQITGNQSTYITTTSGQVATLNRINDITRKIIIGKLSLNALLPIKDKQITNGVAISQEHGLSIEDVVNIIMTDIVNVIAYTEGDGTAVYGYINNDQKIISDMEAKIRNSVRKSYASGSRTLSLDFVSQILKNIENIIMSQSFIG